LAILESALPRDLVFVAPGEGEALLRGVVERKHAAVVDENAEVKLVPFGESGGADHVGDGAVLGPRGDGAAAGGRGEVRARRRWDHRYRGLLDSKTAAAVVASIGIPCFALF
jgi:hypothetical protein